MNLNDIREQRFVEPFYEKEEKITEKAFLDPPKDKKDYLKDVVFNNKGAITILIISLLCYFILNYMKKIKEREKRRKLARREQELLRNKELKL